MWQSFSLGAILISFLNNNAVYSKPSQITFEVSNLVQLGMMLALMGVLCPVVVRESVGKQLVRPYQVKMKTEAFSDSDEEIVLALDRR